MNVDCGTVTAPVVSWAVLALRRRYLPHRFPQQRKRKATTAGARGKAIHDDVSSEWDAGGGGEGYS